MSQFTKETVRALKQTMLQRAAPGWRFSRQDIETLVAMTALSEWQIIKWSDNLLTHHQNDTRAFLEKEEEDKVF